MITIEHEAMSGAFSKIHVRIAAIKRRTGNQGPAGRYVSEMDDVLRGK